MYTLRILFVSFGLGIFTIGAAIAQPWPCGFDPEALRFAGSSLEQARCLLRPVKKWGHLGDPLTQIPAPLDELIGSPVNVDRDSFSEYLAQQGVSEGDLGGPLSGAFSVANDEIATPPSPHYFIIHDTSSPYFRDDPFPDDLDENASVNQLSVYDRGSNAVAHVFINRAGESLTALDFSTPWRATKLEMSQELHAKGLFLHIELIQPRRRDPAGGSQNDAMAPEPGFTQPQLRRLALVYVAASLRHGSWMIPAFHAVVDHGFADAHDDPQSFDLRAWAHEVRGVLEDLERSGVGDVRDRRRPTPAAP